MWPKMLIELLPHLTRLVPMWEKFLTSRQANDKASENALTAMAEGVRGDLGQVTAAHAGLYRQLQDQNAQIDMLRADIARATAAAERAEAAARERDPALAKLAALGGWIKGGVVATVVLLLVVILLELRRRGA